MPTLPLISPVTHRDGWRQVRAPGGYECWHFVATSDNQKLHLTIGFWLGFPGDRDYLRKYERYCAKPTKIAPPTPAEFPSLIIEIEGGDSETPRFGDPIASTDFAAAPERGDATFGTNSVKALSAGGSAISVRSKSEPFAAELTFRGTPSDEEIVEGHRHVVVVAADCVVTGEVEIEGRMQPFSGKGTHRHLFGTRWVDPKAFSLLRR